LPLLFTSPSINTFPSSTDITSFNTFLFFVTKKRGPCLPSAIKEVNTITFSPLGGISHLIDPLQNLSLTNVKIKLLKSLKQYLPFGAISFSEIGLQYRAVLFTQRI